MVISVICDQKDCRFNMGCHVHHDHVNDNCEHPFPRIYKYPTGFECKSKESKITLKNVNLNVERFCGECRLPAKSCMNCCHRNK